MANRTNYPSQIKIAAINVNSLITNYRRFELLHFAQLHNLDIILISETKLNSKYRLQFKEYNIIRTERLNATRGGGTAILMKNKFQYKTITHPSSHNYQILEYTIIKLVTNNNSIL